MALITPPELKNIPEEIKGQVLTEKPVMSGETSGQIEPKPAEVKPLETKPPSQVQQVKKAPYRVEGIEKPESTMSTSALSGRETVMPKTETSRELHESDTKGIEEIIKGNEPDRAYKIESVM